MTSQDRPYFTFQSLLIEYVGEAARAKLGEIYVNLGDWLRIQEAVGKKIQITEHADGSESLDYRRIKITYKPNIHPEDGVLDLRDPDNPHVIRD